jgi:phenylacetate-CoA ligase
MFHVLADACVVEVLRPNGTPAGPGEEGELVCTGLLDGTMPLIRYRIGDRAVQAEGTCRCGRTGPLLNAITGRVEDVVLTPDGRSVGRLDHVFKDTVGVREAQIVQATPNLLLVRVVPRGAFGPVDESQIRRELNFRTGGTMKIEIIRVDGLQRTASGKLPFVISALRSSSPGAVHQSGDRQGQAMRR